MAEVFEKPKKFTKEWFSYVWEYYKVHIIAGIYAFLLLLITLVEISNRVYFEVNLNIISIEGVKTEYAEAIASKAEKFVEDANDDGEKHVALTQISFTNEVMQDMNQLTAAQNKLMTLFASNEEMLFLFDEAMLNDVLSMDSTEGIFVPVDKWCSEKLNKDRCFAFADGIYAVNLKKSAILKQLGINGENLYLCVRMNYEPEDELLNKRYENCVAVANALVRE